MPVFTFRELEEGILNQMNFQEPTMVAPETKAPEVFMNRFKSVNNKDGTWTIYDVDIFCELKRTFQNEGSPKTYHFTKEWLATAVQKALSRYQDGYLPTLHVGHNNDEEKEAEVVGFFLPKAVKTKIYRGQQVWAIYSDWVIPDAVYQRIKNLKFPYRSVEINDYESGEISSCALLQSKPPWVKSSPLVVEETSPENVGPSAFVQEWKSAGVMMFSEDSTDLDFEEVESVLSPMLWEKLDKSKLNFAVPEPVARLTVESSSPNVASKLLKRIESALDISKSLGIPRAEMPQIPQAMMSQFVKSLQSSNVPIRGRFIPANELKATQKELNAGKILNMMNSKVPINHMISVVSSDGFLLDGHHRWVADLLKDPTTPQKCVEVGLPIDELFDKVRAFKAIPVTKEMQFGGKGSGAKVGREGTAKGGRPAAVKDSAPRKRRSVEQLLRDATSGEGRALRSKAVRRAYQIIQNNGGSSDKLSQPAQQQIQQMVQQAVLPNATPEERSWIRKVFSSVLSGSVSLGKSFLIKSFRFLWSALKFVLNPITYAKIYKLGLNVLGHEIGIKEALKHPLDSMEKAWGHDDVSLTGAVNTKSHREMDRPVLSKEQIDRQLEQARAKALLDAGGVAVEKRRGKQVQLTPDERKKEAYLWNIPLGIFKLGHKRGEDISLRKNLRSNLEKHDIELSRRSERGGNYSESNLQSMVREHLKFQGVRSNKATIAGSHPKEVYFAESILELCNVYRSPKDTPESSRLVVALKEACAHRQELISKIKAVAHPSERMGLLEKLKEAESQIDELSDKLSFARRIRNVAVKIRKELPKMKAQLLEWEQDQNYAKTMMNRMSNPSDAKHYSNDEKSFQRKKAIMLKRIERFERTLELLASDDPEKVKLGLNERIGVYAEPIPTIRLDFQSKYDNLTHEKAILSSFANPDLDRKEQELTEYLKEFDLIDRAIKAVDPKDTDAVEKLYKKMIVALKNVDRLYAEEEALEKAYARVVSKNVWGVPDSDSGQKLKRIFTKAFWGMNMSQALMKRAKIYLRAKVKDWFVNSNLDEFAIGPSWHRTLKLWENGIANRFWIALGKVKDPSIIVKPKKVKFDEKGRGRKKAIMVIHELTNDVESSLVNTRSQLEDRLLAISNLIGNAKSKGSDKADTIDPKKLDMKSLKREYQRILNSMQEVDLLLKTYRKSVIRAADEGYKDSQRDIDILSKKIADAKAKLKSLEEDSPHYNQVYAQILTWTEDVYAMKEEQKGLWRQVKTFFQQIGTMGKFFTKSAFKEIVSAALGPVFLVYFATQVLPMKLFGVGFFEMLTSLNLKAKFFSLLGFSEYAGQCEVLHFRQFNTPVSLKFQTAPELRIIRDLREAHRNWHKADAPKAKAKFDVPESENALQVKADKGDPTARKKLAKRTPPKRIKGLTVIKPLKLGITEYRQMERALKQAEAIYRGGKAHSPEEKKEAYETMMELHTKAPRLKAKLQNIVWDMVDAGETIQSLQSRVGEVFDINKMLFQEEKPLHQVPHARRSALENIEASPTVTNENLAKLVRKVAPTLDSKKVRISVQAIRNRMNKDRRTKQYLGMLLNAMISAVAPPAGVVAFAIQVVGDITDAVRDRARIEGEKPNWKFGGPGSGCPEDSDNPNCQDAGHDIEEKVMPLPGEESKEPESAPDRKAEILERYKKMQASRLPPEIEEEDEDLEDLEDDEDWPVPPHTKKPKAPPKVLTKAEEAQKSQLVSDFKTLSLEKKQALDAFNEFKNDFAEKHELSVDSDDEEEVALAISNKLENDPDFQAHLKAIGEIDSTLKISRSKLKELGVDSTELSKIVGRSQVESDREDTGQSLFAMLMNDILASLDMSFRFSETASRKRILMFDEMSSLATAIDNYTDARQNVEEMENAPADQDLYHSSLALLKKVEHEILQKVDSMKKRGLKPSMVRSALKQLVKHPKAVSLFFADDLLTLRTELAHAHNRNDQEGVARVEEKLYREEARVGQFVSIVGKYNDTVKRVERVLRLGQIPGGMAATRVAHPAFEQLEKVKSLMARYGLKPTFYDGLEIEPNVMLYRIRGVAPLNNSPKAVIMAKKILRGLKNMLFQEAKGQFKPFPYSPSKPKSFQEGLKLTQEWVPKKQNFDTTQGKDRLQKLQSQFKQVVQSIIANNTDFQTSQEEKIARNKKLKPIADRYLIEANLIRREMGYSPIDAKGYIGKAMDGKQLTDMDFCSECEEEKQKFGGPGSGPKKANAPKKARINPLAVTPGEDSTGYGIFTKKADASGNRRHSDSFYNNPKSEQKRRSRRFEKDFNKEFPGFGKDSPRNDLVTRRQGLKNLRRIRKRFEAPEDDSLEFGGPGSGCAPDSKNPNCQNRKKEENTDAIRDDMGITLRGDYKPPAPKPTGKAAYKPLKKHDLESGDALHEGSGDMTVMDLPAAADLMTDKKKLETGELTPNRRLAILKQADKIRGESMESEQGEIIRPIDENDLSDENVERAMDILEATQKGSISRADSDFATAKTRANLVKPNLKGPLAIGNIFNRALQKGMDQKTFTRKTLAMASSFYGDLAKKAIKPIASVGTNIMESTLRTIVGGASGALTLNPAEMMRRGPLSEKYTGGLGTYIIQSVNGGNTNSEYVKAAGKDPDFARRVMQKFRRAFGLRPGLDFQESKQTLKETFEKMIENMKRLEGMLKTNPNDENAKASLQSLKERWSKLFVYTFNHALETSLEEKLSADWEKHTSEKDPSQKMQEHSSELSTKELFIILNRARKELQTSLGVATSARPFRATNRPGVSLSLYHGTDKSKTGKQLRVGFITISPDGKPLVEIKDGSLDSGKIKQILMKHIKGFGKGKSENTVFNESQKQSLHFGIIDSIKSLVSSSYRIKKQIDKLNTDIAVYDKQITADRQRLKLHQNKVISFERGEEQLLAMKSKKIPYDFLYDTLVSPQNVNSLIANNQKYLREAKGEVTSLRNKIEQMETIMFQWDDQIVELETKLAMKKKAAKQIQMRIAEINEQERLANKQYRELTHQKKALEEELEAAEAVPEFPSYEPVDLRNAPKSKHASLGAKTGHAGRNLGSEGMSDHKMEIQKKLDSVTLQRDRLKSAMLSNMEEQNQLKTKLESMMGFSQKTIQKLMFSQKFGGKGSGCKPGSKNPNCQGVGKGDHHAHQD